MSALSRVTKIEHPEDRSEDEYKAEVEEYLTKARDRLPEAIEALKAERSGLVKFGVRNRTDANFHKVLVKMHVEGAVDGYSQQGKFTSLQRLAGTPPRLFGPWTETRSPLGDIRANYPNAYQASPSLPKTYDPVPRPDIRNGGSSNITFPSVDLRPRSVSRLTGPVYLTATATVEAPIRCTWTATATNVNGVAEGLLTVALDPKVVDLGEILSPF